MRLKFLFALGFALSCDSSEDAVAAAREHIKTIYPSATISGITCQSYDTDNDKYVSCSAGITFPNGTVQSLSLECATNFSWNEGCRSPKAVLRPW